MEKSERFLVLVKNSAGSPKRFYLDNIVLEGNVDDLYNKMSDVDYVKSESFWFDPRWFY